MQALKLAVVSLCVAGVASADPLRRTRIADRVDELPVARLRRPPVPVPHADPKTAAVGNELAGTWTCTGAVDKIAIKTALDGAWVQWTIAGGAGTTIQYRTYDGIAKQWTLIELTASGKHRTLTSLGPENALWTWTLEDHRELESLATKDTLELSGERRHGTAWTKNYAATCRRAKK